VLMIAFFVGASVLILFKIHMQIKDVFYIVQETKGAVYKLTAPSKVEFYISVDGKKEKVGNMVLKLSQKLPLFIAIKDKFGNEAVVDGAPKWSVTDESLAEVVVAEDGMSAEVMPKGQLGAFKVQVHADADLGEGIKDLLGEMSVELIAAEAAVIEIGAGEPVDIG
jgi:hypothetical protein